MDLAAASGDRDKGEGRDVLRPHGHCTVKCAEFHGSYIPHPGLPPAAF